MPLFTIQASNDFTPVGAYQTTFTGLEPIETEHGKAYRWLFTTGDGKTISAIADGEKPPTQKNKMGRFLSALSRQPLQAGVSVDPDKYVGQKYLVIVSHKDDGVGTKVDTFSAIN